MFESLRARDGADLWTEGSHGTKSKVLKFSVNSEHLFSLVKGQDSWTLLGADGKYSDLWLEIADEKASDWSDLMTAVTEHLKKVLEKSKEHKGDQLIANAIVHLSAAYLLDELSISALFSIAAEKAGKADYYQSLTYLRAAQRNEFYRDSPSEAILKQISAASHAAMRGLLGQISEDAISAAQSIDQSGEPSLANSIDGLRKYVSFYRNGPRTQVVKKTLSPAGIRFTSGHSFETNFKQTKDDDWSVSCTLYSDEESVQPISSLSSWHLILCLMSEYAITIPAVMHRLMRESANSYKVAEVMMNNDDLVFAPYLRDLNIAELEVFAHYMIFVAIEAMKTLFGASVVMSDEIIGTAYHRLAEAQQWLRSYIHMAVPDALEEEYLPFLREKYSEIGITLPVKEN